MMLPKDHTYYLDREVFNRDINEIYAKSQLIKDSWVLIKSNPLVTNDTTEIFYLEKKEQKLFGNKMDQINDEQNFVEVYSFIYHVIFSESYSVPVLYLTGFKSNGTCLS